MKVNVVCECVWGGRGRGRAGQGKHSKAEHPYRHASSSSSSTKTKCGRWCAGMSERGGGWLAGWMGEVLDPPPLLLLLLSPCLADSPLSTLNSICLATRGGMICIARQRIGHRINRFCKGCLPFRLFTRFRVSIGEGNCNEWLESSLW